MFPMTSFPSRFVRTAGLLSALLAGAAAQATVIYSNLPAVLPGNLPSFGYEAVALSEFGDHISFAGSARNLQSATITMSNWAQAGSSTAPGYNHDLTFNIYNYASDTAVGSLIATKTLNTLVPWRPAADTVRCTEGRWYSESDGGCYNGIAFNVTFDFSTLGIVLPDEIVYGLAFNTRDYGAVPTGQDGPYNSLNYAVVDAAPSVGTDVNPDSIFWNTAYKGNTSGPGTTGTFSADYYADDTEGWAWRHFRPVASFEAVPEPTTLALFGLAIAGLAATRRRKV